MEAIGGSSSSSSSTTPPSSQQTRIRIRKRCIFRDQAGAPCGRSAQGQTKFCIAHGGGARCIFRDQAGAPCGRSARGQPTKFCVAHGGGFRCARADAHLFDDQHPSAYYKAGDDRFCWGCYSALYPDLARLKVRKEQFVLADVQRRLADLLCNASNISWDCPIPGGCTLLRPDLLVRFPSVYLQVEVDEFGHCDKSCDQEDSRLELIAADLGLPGLVIRINPDVRGLECFRRTQLRNGEIAFQAVGKNFSRLMDRVENAVRSNLSRCSREERRGIMRIFVDSSLDSSLDS